MENIILETRELCKTFKDQKAVDNISLLVPENCVYGLLGPNGAGKSTLLKIITGMMRASSGEVLFHGKSWKREYLKETGALIETPPIYENLSAVENLEVRAIALGIPKGRIDEVLEIVDLNNTGKKRAGQFSLGMKQRLGIAIALLNQPKLLILDEPMNGLDPYGILELREMIKGFPKKGITVILSSHILSEVEQTVDYIGIMSDGMLGYQGQLPKESHLEEMFLEITRRYRNVSEGGY